MVLWKRCPYCKEITYLNEGMSTAFCISCGRRINATMTAELGTTKPENVVAEESYTITFCYERRFASEYDTGCQITIDNHLAGVSSVDAPLPVKLTKGNHNVVIKVLAHMGIHSTNVISSINMYVDQDKTYYVKARGSSFNRKIIITETKE